MSSKYRKMFADTAYNITKDNVTLDLATSSYDDIIAAITNDNMLYVAIFFFGWCYEDSGDGISNDKIYFDTFVDSKLFDCILNRKVASEDSIMPSGGTGGGEASGSGRKGTDRRIRAGSFYRQVQGKCMEI